MTASSILPAPNLMPLMRYRDLAEAMGWLERAFDFEKQIAVSDNDGEVIYGQMIYRGSLLMMGAVRDTDLDKLMRQPDEVGGVETQSCYIVVDDADAHYAKAQNAGAEIVLEIKSDGLGRRGYSCRDPEGHIWNFGTYSPGKGLSMTVAALPPVHVEPPPTPRRNSPRLLMSLAALVTALGATCWWLANEIHADFSDRVARASGYTAQDAERAYAELVKVRSEKRKTDELVQSLNTQMAAEKARRLHVEAEAKKIADSIAQEQNARRAAESAVASLREELKRDRETLEAAIEARRVSEEKLAVQTSAPDPAKEKPDPNDVVASEEGPPVPLVDPASAAKYLAAPAPEGVSGIETSATQPAKAEAQADDDDEKAKSPAKRFVRSWRRISKSGSRRILPTYIIGLHDVPWPYTTWYK